MKPNLIKPVSIVAVLCIAGTLAAQAQTSEMDQMKAAMDAMQKSMNEMQNKMKQMEQDAAAAKAAPAATTSATNSPSVVLIEKTAAGEDIGHASPITSRDALKDEQEGAQRPNDLTLDPKYRGFIPIPNTPGLIKFNAKPRVDVTSDSRNAGNPDRFSTATIPVEGQAGFGGSEQFNINARGSSLSVDVRAPEIPGNFRFYYNNDFYGGGVGAGMQFRIKHLYGQFYNVTAGFTYSCFEDPDAWPDTVDFEGPNGVIFARRPLIRYQLPVSDSWQMNFGVEAPASEIDGNSTALAFNQSTKAPDVTANVRWEDSKWGHVQLGGVVRSIGVSGAAGNQDVFGGGVNLACSINVFKRDSFQAQATYGEGIFRYINDNFANNDAAFDAAGDLQAIPCFAAAIGYTHHWCEDVRSTATYGYVNLDNEITQGPDAYHETHYASLNVIWQLRKRLSVGAEALYGKKEVQSGATGDVWRFQLGLVYSLFD